MTMMNLLLAALLAVVTLALAFWAYKLGRLLQWKLQSSSADMGDLQARVIPILAYVGLAAIMIKLTVF